MKKVLLFLIASFWGIQSMSAQLSTQQMELLSMNQTVDSSKEECFELRIRYYCTDNCLIQIWGGCVFDISCIPITNIVETYNDYSNKHWTNFTGEVCFTRGLKTFESRVNCRAGSEYDGCVVVIEGGG